ncbi:MULTISPECIES: HNH endonuclease signature motif containing protein [unclassified Crossiella]|uniref:HNH endonuclease signature motif containing protein n=1 Tax=unclassified Crossiella TaxID=2620835 RepID=UPI00200015ED|nr:MULTISPECIES: HNH endonuclease signature motif containing protein [unclassified Crossiella]MCK2239615.1 HNH endonuclease [Crossiella sp. S99.2]MCK2252310.1 HNH endonuclease [Crossiella sp. S99.1]
MTVPITAEMAREPAMDANIKRLLTGPDGSVVGYDARRYKPPTWMTELVKARNPRRTFPGCRRKAHGSDLDHTIPHENGGPTSPHNLGPLCRHHHRLKQTAAWPRRLHQHPGGRFTWTSPTNRVYHTSPEPR